DGIQCRQTVHTEPAGRIRSRRAGVTLPDEELRAEANKWELSHGGISGRTAEQFVSYLASQPDAFK
ncbi:MAG: DUF815 domain-containing protein, partial [Lachnospiraceae bacterium]|nr:DUF815 domain-containing protein [Lachnospiraceae bacterium]